MNTGELEELIGKLIAGGVTVVVLTLGPVGRPAEPAPQAAPPPGTGSTQSCGMAACPPRPRTTACSVSADASSAPILYRRGSTPMLSAAVSSSRIASIARPTRLRATSHNTSTDTASNP